MLPPLTKGALFHSMLDNDKSQFFSTLDVINTLSGIDEVNLYNEFDSLVYSSFSADAQHYNQPDCIQRHNSLSELFQSEGKSFRIVGLESACSMYRMDNRMRYLLIRSPILNETSCYTASCHAHGKDDYLLGSLEIKLPLGEFDQSVSSITRRYFSMALIATVLISSLLLLFTWKNVKKPLAALIEASRAVSSGQTNTRLDTRVGQTEEMRLVSQAFNEMLDKLQTANLELENWSKQLEYKVQRKSEELSSVQNELIQIERIASLGKLSASVAHELNNPLSGILVYSKLLLKQIQNMEFEPQRKEAKMKHLSFIESETKRCGDIVKRLLDYSRKDSAEHEPNHLNDILASTADLVRHQMKISGISFYARFEATKDLVRCSPNQIKQACLALLVNASEAIAPGTGGEITIVTINPDDKHIQFDVCDTGHGMNSDIIPHIFEPFFSTKHEASAIGLGLAIVHGIINSHNGKIKVVSELCAGTTFSITLPLLASKNE